MAASRTAESKTVDVAEALRRYEGAPMPKPSFLPVARDAHLFLFEMGIGLGFAIWSETWWLILIAATLLGFVILFFRDFERKTPEGEGLVISPADGKVIKVETVREDRILKRDALKISIFMNIFNCHVNRAAVTGVVRRVSYNKGKFINASFDKASLDNEQNAVVVETPTGKTVMFTQIAGLIARRIVCYAATGTPMKAGDRFGIIKFGSRLDVYLPTGTKVDVAVGDKVKAGVSILGRLS